MSSTEGDVLVSAEEYLYYARHAVDGMREIVRGLGDDLANRRPDIDGANSPYALLTHCLGVIDYWAGHVLSGRAIERDRAAEFVATGPVVALSARVDETFAALERDVRRVRSDVPPANRPDPAYLGAELVHTPGGVLVHVLEELMRHHGQMEITRDALLAEQRSAGTGE